MSKKVGDSVVSGNSLQVQKKYEYQLLIEYVQSGAWKNNTWLASVLGVDEDTVSAWKKTEPVMKARQEAIKGLLKDFTGKGEIKDRLAETGFKVETQKSEEEIVVKIYDYGTQSNSTTKTT